MAAFGGATLKSGYFASQSLRLSFSEICAGEKIGTDHLQAVAARLVGPEHKADRFKRFLDHGQLTLVKLEVDNFSGLSLFPGKMPLDFSLEAFLR